MKLKSKQTPFRAVGQRSIVSSFPTPSSNPFRVSKAGSQNEASDKKSRVSLSDFLQRKLNEASGLPRTVKGKAKPFSSLLGLKGLSGSTDEKIGTQKGEEAESNPVVQKVVLEQFKHNVDIVKEEDFPGSSSNGEAETCNITNVQASRKRKSFGGGNEKHLTRKHVVILGGDPKRKQQRRDNNFISKENQVPTYNHYANGGGWWDSNMEGVDNEEVGFSEVWEGVGSTTFGGIVDWH